MKKNPTTHSNSLAFQRAVSSCFFLFCQRRLAIISVFPPNWPPLEGVGPESRGRALRFRQKFKNKKEKKKRSQRLTNLAPRFRCRLQEILLRETLSKNPDKRPTTFGIRRKPPLNSFQVHRVLFRPRLCLSLTTNLLLRRRIVPGRIHLRHPRIPALSPAASAQHVVPHAVVGQHFLIDLCPVSFFLCVSFNGVRYLTARAPRHPMRRSLHHGVAIRSLFYSFFLFTNLFDPTTR